MNVTRILALSIAAFAIAGYSTAASADAAAGKAKFAAACAECSKPRISQVRMPRP